MNPQELAHAVVSKMRAVDGFSAWLGIEVSSLSPGSAVCTMKVRREMLNGFGVCHGGIAYALADSAFAFASNAHGRVSVALDTSISYPAPVLEGDTLTAAARELSRTENVGFYEVEVKSQRGEAVAHFRGTVYRTKKTFFPENAQ